MHQACTYGPRTWKGERQRPSWRAAVAIPLGASSSSCSIISATTTTSSSSNTRGLRMMTTTTTTTTLSRNAAAATSRIMRAQHRWSSSPPSSSPPFRYLLHVYPKFSSGSSSSRKLLSSSTATARSNAISSSSSFSFCADQLLFAGNRAAQQQQYCYSRSSYCLDRRHRSSSLSFLSRSAGTSASPILIQQQQQQQQQQFRWHTTNRSSTSSSSSSSTVEPGTKKKNTTTKEAFDSPDLSPAASDKDKENESSDWRIFQTLLRYVWPSQPAPSDSTPDELRDVQQRKRRVVASLGLMLAGKGVTIQVPFVFKHLIDSMPQQQQVQVAASSSADAITAAANAATAVDPTTIATALPVALLLGYGMSRACASALQEWRNYVFAHVAQGAIRSVGRQTFDHTLRQDLQFHLHRHTGQLSRILDRGQRSIAFVLNAMVFHVGPTALEVGLVAALMAHQCGPAHVAVVLATVTAYTGFTFAVTSWRTQFRRAMNRLDNQASGRVVDSLLNYETVHYFNNARHEGERYEESLRGYQKAALDAQASLSLLNAGQAAIFSAGLTSVMWLTSQQILAGTATVGDLVLVNGLLFQLSVPLFFIGGVYREVRQSFIDMEAMFNLRATVPTVRDRPDATVYQPSTMGTHIALRDVHFAYPTAAAAHTQRPILNGVTCEIPQGQTVAIVGSSGCGKSTILRLLYRFYNADAGLVTVGGHDLLDLEKESLQRAVAVVPQDVVLFHESIGYNIQYGNLNASWDQVVEAAKKAKIHDTILSFPDGYDTIVGERGLKLSGGEKQRVSIARAILKEAPILLCDEPTSSLDSETENDIMNNLKAIGSDRTTIIIAHRLSTIQDCDQIVVMHLGKVVERGTHEELLQKGGRYVELLKMQEFPDDDKEEDGAEVPSATEDEENEDPTKDPK